MTTYAKGYAAGRKRAKLERSQAAQLAKRRAFRERAFLAALPSFLDTSNAWQRSEHRLTALSDLVTLAWEAADEAMKRYFG
jgi:hypothetical protein